MMNDDKKILLLQWFSKLWGRKLDSLSQLQDGGFFLHVLNFISHWYPHDVDISNKHTTILAVKKFLQDFYHSGSFEGVLDFDAVFSDDVATKEMELAKLAVILLGVALVDKEAGDVVKRASMELPEHLHADVVCLLETVVQMNGQGFVLSSNIERALQTPSAEVIETTTPLTGIAISTPMAQCRKKSSDTPLNVSFGISSPLRDMSIGSSVSPFISYIQSPQLIRKALLKEKELELRHLKAQLNEQVLFKEDAQMSLQEQMKENTKKDSKINELKNRIKELQALQDANDELHELKPKFNELEIKYEKLISHQKKLDQYKSDCVMLEKESTCQRDEIDSMHQEIHGLKIQLQQKREELMAKKSIEKEMEWVKVQFDESSKLNALLHEEMTSLKANLNSAEEKYKDLKKMTEESNDESFQGESMGVVMDIQLWELKGKVEELSQERDELQREILSLKASIEDKNSVHEEMKKQVEVIQQMNDNLVTHLKDKSTSIESLKVEFAEQEINRKNMLIALKSKHEKELQVIRTECDKKMDSLSEANEISLKRYHTANEKVLLEKDRLSQELKEWQQNVRNLEEKYAKEVELLIGNTEKRLLTQRTEFEQESMKQQQQIDLEKSELISESARQLDNLKKVNEEKLLLLKEENEITLLKMKDDMVSEMKSQKSRFEEQISRLQSTNDELLSKKKDLENRLSLLDNEMASQLESQAVAYEKEQKRLQEQNEQVQLDEKTEWEKKMAVVKESFHSQVTSLECELKIVKEKSQIDLEQLKKEYNKMEYNLNEKMLSDGQRYENEVDDLHNKVQNVEIEKAKMEENLRNLEEKTLIQLKEKEENYAKNLSIISEESSSKLNKLSEDYKDKVVEMEAQNLENLAKQKFDFETIISGLHEEKSGIVSQQACLEEKLRMSDEEISKLSSFMSAVEKEKADVDSEKCKLAERLISLEAENAESLVYKARLEEEIAALQKENSCIFSQKEELNSLLKNVQLEHADLLLLKSRNEDEIARLLEECKSKETQITEKESQVNELRQEKSDTTSQKEKAEDMIMVLKQALDEKDSQNLMAGDTISKLQQTNIELNSQKLALENELKCIQQRLSDTLTEKKALECDLSTLEQVKSDILSQKTFVEEEFTCLKQERSEILSQKGLMETNIVNLQTEMDTLKNNIEEQLACKEQNYTQIMSEKEDLSIKLTNLQKEMLKLLESLAAEHEITIKNLDADNSAKIDSLIKDHTNEIDNAVKEKSELTETISNLNSRLNAAISQIEDMSSQLSESEKLVCKLQKQVSVSLEEEQRKHENVIAEVQVKAEERLSVEKAQLEEIVVKRMELEAEDKVLQVREEYKLLIDQLKEENSIQLNQEKENNKKEFVEMKRQTSEEINSLKNMFEDKTIALENEFSKKVSLEQEEKDRLVSVFNEEKRLLEELVGNLQCEATEAVQKEKQSIVELHAVIERLKDENTDLATRKENFEKQIKVLQETSDAKLIELSAQYHNDLESMRLEMNRAETFHREQLEEELSKVRLEAQKSYEANLDELKSEFEVAKESELKAFAAQKADFLAVKEQFESDTKEHISQIEMKLKEVKDENNQLRERETTLLKNSETQMATANDFCNNLRHQLEAANAKITKLEGSPVRGKLQLLEQQFLKQKETNSSLNNALKIEKETNAKMQQRLDTHMAKHEKTKSLLENAHKETRVYAIENNRLKTSLDYSERKLQSFKKQLEQGGNTTIGSDADFRRHIEEHDFEMLNDSLDANTSIMSSYSLRSTNSRSKGSNHSDEGSGNETIISADSVMMRRETLASSSDLRKKGAPSVFRPSMQSCANEPEDYDWDRLSELKRRNTLCLPHMKSSYPVETQNADKKRGSDDDVQVSLRPDETSKLDLKPGKRRSPRLSSVLPDEDDTATCPSKKAKEETADGTTIYFPLARDGAVYQPPTAPSSTRSSGKQKTVSSVMTRKKLTPSKSNKSPGKLTTRGRSYKSPGFKTKSPASARINRENENKASVAFSIGFTPKSSARSSRMVQKKTSNKDSMLTSGDQNNSSPRKKVRKPLATRNYRETGL